MQYTVKYDDGGRMLYWECEWCTKYYQLTLDTNLSDVGVECMEMIGIDSTEIHNESICTECNEMRETEDNE